MLHKKRQTWNLQRTTLVNLPAQISQLILRHRIDNTPLFRLSGVIHELRNLYLFTNGKSKQRVYNAHKAVLLRSVL